MGVRGQVDDPDRVALGCGLLHDGQQVAGQRDVAHVVERHVAIDAVGGELVGHDAAAGVVDQDVDAVGLVGDSVGGFFGLLEVGQIAPKPGHFLRRLFAHLLCDCAERVLDHVLGQRDDEQLLDAVSEESVRASIPNTL